MFSVLRRFCSNNPINYSPKRICEELNKFIIGQEDAKRAVSIALRTRWRRRRLPEELKSEVTPKNILMIGPTGCGKTEIARRLANISGAPFLKVEATKFTEVGYHGRDVDQIIKDLVAAGIHQTRKNLRRDLEELEPRIQQIIEDYILEHVLGPDFPYEERREIKRQQLRSGQMDDRTLYLEIPDMHKILTKHGEADNLQSAIEALNIFRPGRTLYPYKEKMTIREAKNILHNSFTDGLIKEQNIIQEALKQVQENGIVFLDEIDKIATPADAIRTGNNPSADGVQRDLLPLIEGTMINTKHGDVSTEHILFIASGAFSDVKPSDLLAELQGRLPIRVTLQPLTTENFKQILTQTDNNMIKQQVALMATENIELVFLPDAIDKIAEIAYELNMTVENIGARRLYSVIEKVLEDIAFDAPTHEGQRFEVTQELVQEKLSGMLKTVDLKKHLL